MTIRIGVLGAARIVPEALVRPAADTEGVEVVVIAARDRERAKAFAAEHDIPRVASDYQAVVDDPDVDAVFNPLPNSLHAPWTIAALEAGKHVLCEKPFSLDAAEAEAMVAAAERAGLVLMEAFHWRYHPLADRIKELAGPAHLGALRHVSAEFSVPILDTSDIRYDLALGGGALMDLGSYTVQWVRHLVGDGEPEVVSAVAEEAPTAPGIDVTMTAELRWPSGVTGSVRCSMQPPEGGVAIRADAIGDQARLEVLNPLTPSHGHRIRLLPPGDGAPLLEEQVEGRTTYHHQLEAFVGAVRDGLAVPTGGTDAIATMRVIDAVYAAGRAPTAKMTPVELAEGPQISGEVMLLILAVMLLMLVVGLAMIVLGCVWAYRAGRGSETSRIAFGIVAVVEILLFVMSVTENSTGYSLLLLLAVQAACFFAGRRRGPAPVLPGDDDQRSPLGGA